jgi:3-hydroxyacyl-CoA dehydrogenase/enoyl-CoA hydratase/3-hydroxybutyryl-CoA epimerase
MDDPARKVNVLDEGAIAGLEAAVAELERATDLGGVVLASGKRGSFIAGADIEVIASITDPAQVRKVVERAQAVFTRFSELTVPTVAAIDGVCLGGGLEIAAACDSRIAAEDRAQIGVPEVMLGIFPGLVAPRMPRPTAAALDLILTSRTLDAKRAEAGLIAWPRPPFRLIEAAGKHRAVAQRRHWAVRRVPRPRARRRCSGNRWPRRLPP